MSALAVLLRKFTVGMELNEKMNTVEREQLNDAANRLEELTTMLKQVTLNLRDGAPNAYAQVYWLRQEMSKIVASLGIGVPTDLDITGHGLENMYTIKVWTGFRTPDVYTVPETDLPKTVQRLRYDRRVVRYTVNDVPGDKAEGC
jgi:hypothetical protein